mmetsp:Transcript_66156/g.175325  ORF Transcript_66156/g.175325 Transcript_66156/m.175325 type:complete len:311 (-) Transcript_66156:113-1045(-)
MAGRLRIVRVQELVPLAFTSTGAKELEGVQQLFWKSSKHLVEDVVVLFMLLLRHDSRRLQEEGFDASPDQRAHGIKTHVDVFPEAGRVTISHRCGVAKGFQDGTGVCDFLLDTRTMCRISSGRGSEVSHDDLCRLGFPSSAFTADDQRLVPSLSQELTIRCVSDCIGMRRQRPDVLVSIKRKLLGRVQIRYGLVRVYGQKNGGRVSVDLVLEMSAMHVVQDVRLVEVHQRGIIIARSRARSFTTRAYLTSSNLLFARGRLVVIILHVQHEGVSNGVHADDRGSSKAALLTRRPHEVTNVEVGDARRSIGR